MKTHIPLACLVLALPQFAGAGGNTSIVEISKVSDITFEEKKITIKGDGVVRRRIMCTEEKSDSKVFGQPGQWFHAKVRDGVFEIIPYDSRPEIKGVPSGGPMTPEMQKRIDRIWNDMVARARQVKVGGGVTIGYQADVTTLNGVRLTRIVGWGSVRAIAAK